MILFFLFIFTSAYTERLAVYPDMERCAVAAAMLEETLNVRPRAVMARFACIPTLMPPPIMAPPRDEPSF